MLFFKKIFKGRILPQWWESQYLKNCEDSCSCFCSFYYDKHFSSSYNYFDLKKLKFVNQDFKGHLFALCPNFSLYWLSSPFDVLRTYWNSMRPPIRRTGSIFCTESLFLEPKVFIVLWTMDENLIRKIFSCRKRVWNNEYHWQVFFQGEGERARRMLFWLKGKRSFW